MSGGDRGSVKIETEADIAAARRTVRDVAARVGFGVTEVARIVTAASELGRNAHKYAGGGVMEWAMLRNGPAAGSELRGLELRFQDHGPGIADVSLALKEGFTTGGGLGMGLPGAKRLMDEMEIESAAGSGTKVTVRKWRRHSV